MGITSFTGEDMLLSELVCDQPMKLILNVFCYLILIVTKSLY